MKEKYYQKVNYFSSAIQQITKVMFNLDDDKDVNFNYTDSKLHTIKLPSFFDFLIFCLKN